MFMDAYDVMYKVGQNHSVKFITSMQPFTINEMDFTITFSEFLRMKSRFHM